MSNNELETAKDVTVYYLAPGDVLKGRVEPIIWMRTCEWLARYGFNTFLLSPYFYRKENIARSDIFSHFGIDPLFRVKILPALLSTRFSGLLWNRVNLLLAYLISLTSIFIRNKKRLVFYSKGQVCMQVVCFLERVFKKKTIKIFEIHSIGENERLVRLLKRMDLIVTNSEIVNSRLIAFGIPKSKLLIAYNAPFSHGVQLDKQTARERLAMDVNETILLYAGKLYGQNLDFFFKLASGLTRSGVKLHIVGGNPKILNEAQARISKDDINNITFHGFQSPAKVNEYLSAADFLFCSYSDDLPNIQQATPAKYFDYMYIGKPIYCSENTAIRELFEDGKNCLFFEPENVESLVSRLLSTMTDKGLLECIVRNNKALIHELSWKNRMGHISSRINSLIKLDGVH